MDYAVSPVPGKQTHLDDAHRRGLPVRVNGVRFGYSDKAGAILSEPLERRRVQMFVDASPDEWRVWDIAEKRWIDWQPTPPPLSLDQLAAREKAALEAEAKPSDPAEAYLLEFRQRYDAASDKTAIPADELKRALFELGQPARPDASREDLLAAYEKAVGIVGEQSPEGEQGESEPNFLAEFAQKVAQGDPKKLPNDEIKKALNLLKVVYNPNGSKAELLELYRQATAE